MKILIFSIGNETISQKIIDGLNQFKNCQIILLEDHQSFKKEFRHCFSGETVVVFFIEGEEDMSFLESMEKEFVDIKLIINQPDHTNSFYGRILSLHPRLITNIRECRELLPGVVRKTVIEMLKTSVTNDTNNPIAF